MNLYQKEMNVPPEPGTKKRLLVAISVIISLILVFSVIFIAFNSSDDSSKITPHHIYEGSNKIKGNAVEVEFNDLAENSPDQNVKNIPDNRPAVEINSPAKTEFRSVAGFYIGSEPEKAQVTTDVVAVEPMEISNAKIRLPKHGPVDHIIQCNDFDFENFVCNNWIVTDIPFEDFGDYIEFDVNHFSAYAGAQITIINVQSYPVVGGTWQVRFTTQGTADLIIEAIDGTTWSNTNEDEDLKFLEIKCGEEIQDYTWENNKVIVTDYSCDEQGTEISQVLTSGKHHLKFTFGEDVGYANNLASLVLWEDIYDNGGNDYSRDIVVDNAGNITITGQSIAGGHYDFYTIQYYPNGTEIWNARFDSGGHDYGFGVAADSSNNIVVVGFIPEGIYNDFYTIKYDQDGNHLWNATHNFSYTDGAQAVAVDSSDNVVVVGRVHSFDRWGLVKYDSAGNHLYNKTDAQSLASQAWGVTTNSSNDIFVVGQFQLGGTYYGLLRVYNSSLDYQWNITLTNSTFYDVALDPSGNIVVVGIDYSEYSSYKKFIAKYNPSGTQLWNDSYYAGSPAYALEDVAINGSGDIFSVAGSGNVVKYNSSGTKIWERNYRTPEDVAVDSEGYIYVTGGYNASIGYDYYTQKYEISDDPSLINITFLLNSSEGTNETDETLTLWADSNFYGDTTYTGYCYKKGSEDAPILDWIENYTFPFFEDITVDNQGNLITCSMNNISSNRGLMIQKFDSDGVLTWNYTYMDDILLDVAHSSTSPWEFLYGFDCNLETDSQANILVAGHASDGSTSMDRGNGTFFKINSSGSMLWNSTFVNTSAFELIIDDQDNTYLAYAKEGPGIYSRYINVSKYNSSGSVLWATVTNLTTGPPYYWCENDLDPSTRVDYPRGIDFDSSGNVFIVSKSISGGWCTNGMHVLGLNPSGTVISNYTINESFLNLARYLDYPESLAIDSQDNLKIMGYTLIQSAYNLNHDVLIQTVNLSGGNKVRNYADGGNHDNALAGIMDDEDNLYLAGRTKSFYGANSVWTLGYDNTGSQLWNKTYQDTDYGYGIYKYNNSLFVAGSHDEKGFIIKYLLNSTVAFNVTSSDQTVNLYSIPSTETVVDDTWECLVNYTNEAVTSSNTSNNLTVLGSTNPDTVTVLVNSTSNISTDDLTCYATGFDPEQSSLNAHYKWYNDSVEVPSLAGNTSGVNVGDLTLISTVANGNLSGGETWTCSVKMDDGTLNETDWNNASLTLKSEPQCGDTLSGSTDYILTQNLSNPASATCLTVSGNDITLDCRGYTINGGSYHFKVDSGTKSNIVLKNCRFENVTYPSFGNFADSVFDNNTIINTVNGPIYYGIYTGTASSNNNISNNRMDNVKYYGVYSGGPGSYVANNVISNIRIGVPRSPYTRGNGIHVYGDNQIIKNNSIYNTSLAQTYYGDGIFLNSGYASNITVIDNLIVASGTYQIYVGGNSYVNVSNNVILDHVPTVYPAVYIGGDHSFFDNNFINNSAGDSFRIAQNAFNNTFTNNQVNNSGEMGFEVDIDDDSLRSNITQSNTVDGYPVYYFWKAKDMIFENYDLNHPWGVSRGVVVCVDCDNITFRNNNLSSSNSASGIGLYNVSDSEVYDNYFYNASGVQYSAGVLVWQLTTAQNTPVGSSKDILINNNNFGESGTGNYGYGVYVQGGDDINITNNNFTDLNYHSIYVEGGNRALIDNNIINIQQTPSANANQIYLSTYADNATVSDNTVTTGYNMGNAGLYCSNGEYHQVFNNTIQTPNKRGIFWGCPKGTVTNNTVIGAGTSTTFAVELNSVADYTVFDLNNISGSKSNYGVYLNGPDSVNFTNNLIYNSTLTGIYSSATNSRIINNIILDSKGTTNNYGIYVVSNNCLYEGNVINNSRDYGFGIGTTYLNTFVDNEVNNATDFAYYISGRDKTRKNITQSNTFDGNTVYYYYKQSGITVENNDLTQEGGVNTGVYTFVDSNNIILRNNNISSTNTSSGIGLFNVTDSSISNNWIYDTSDGQGNSRAAVYLEYISSNSVDYCQNVTIENNVLERGEGSGIYSYYNRNISVINNTLSNFDDTIIYMYYSHQGNVSFNNIFGNNAYVNGIQLNGNSILKDNYITYNNISDLRGDGILVSSAYNTRVENNNVTGCGTYSTSTVTERPSIVLSSAYYSVADSNNIVDSVDAGIKLYSCNGCNATNNIINNSPNPDKGIDLFYGTPDLIANNTISGFGYGIYIQPSGTTLTGNKLYNNSLYGLYAYYSSTTALDTSGNTICYNGAAFNSNFNVTNFNYGNNSFCVDGLFPADGSTTDDSTPLLSFNASNIVGTSCIAVIDGVGSGANGSLGPDGANQTIQVNRTLSVGLHELNYTCSDAYDSSAAENSITFEVTAGYPCGIDPITSSTTLTQNYTNDGTGDCITITGDDLILDCAGYTLTGVDSYNGIHTNGTQNVTVQNCNIDNFTVGVNATTVSNFTLQQTNISYCDYGIYINPSEGVEVENAEVENAEEDGLHAKDSEVTVNGITILDDDDTVQTENGIRFVVSNTPFDKICDVNNAKIKVPNGTGIESINMTVSVWNSTFNASTAVRVVGDYTINATIDNCTIYATDTGVETEGSPFFASDLTIDMSQSTNPGAKGIEIGYWIPEEDQFPNVNWLIILPSVGGTGISLMSANNFDVNELDIVGSGNGTGFNATNSTNVTLNNTNITGVDFGVISDCCISVINSIIDIRDSDDPDATGLEIGLGAVPWCGHCLPDPDEIPECKDCSIQLPSGGGTGIKLFSVNNYDVDTTTINGSGTAFNATNSTNVTINNTNITGVDFGIILEDSDDIEIIDTSIRPEEGGILAENSSITIDGSAFHAGVQGGELKLSASIRGNAPDGSGSSIINTVMEGTGSGIGINFTDADNCSILNSTVESLDYGLYIDADSSGIELNNNKFRCSATYDIYNLGSASGDLNYCGLTTGYQDTTRSYWYSDDCWRQPSDCNEPDWWNIPGYDSGTSTFIGNEADMSAVDLTLGSSSVIVNWDSTVDVTDDDYDNSMAFGSDFASIDSSSLDSSINTAGDITFNNIDCNAFNIYYVGSGLYTTGESLRSAGTVVADQTDIGGNCDSGCTNIACASNTLTFDVSGWSGYSTVNSTGLGIWDETDTITKYPGNQVVFYANYTNSSDSSPITGAQCNISFQIAPQGPLTMTYNATSTLYEFNRTFSVPGVSNWNATCSAAGFATVTVTDTVTITVVPAAIPEFSDYALIVALMLVVSGFFFQKFRVYQKQK